MRKLLAKMLKNYRAARVNLTITKVTYWYIERLFVGLHYRNDKPSINIPKKGLALKVQWEKR